MNLALIVRPSVYRSVHSSVHSFAIQNLRHGSLVFSDVLYEVKVKKKSDGAQFFLERSQRVKSAEKVTKMRLRGF